MFRVLIFLTGKGQPLDYRLVKNKMGQPQLCLLSSESLHP